MPGPGASVFNFCYGLKPLPMENPFVVLNVYYPFIVLLGLSESKESYKKEHQAFNQTQANVLSLMGELMEFHSSDR